MVSEWVIGQLRSQLGIATDRIDPLELDLSHVHGANLPGIDALKGKLAVADGFVVVTPEYNRGYTAALKAVIDSAGQEWHARPVAFVSYGGISGGLRAVEQLRQVFAELHTVTIRDTVSFANVWSQFDSQGELIDPEPASAAFRTMLSRLEWWARALKTARSRLPYGEVVA